MPRTAVTPWASTGTRGYRERTEGKGWQAARLLPHEAAAAAAAAGYDNAGHNHGGNEANKAENTKGNKA